jgi:hypothetical protein
LALKLKAMSVLGEFGKNCNLKIIMGRLNIKFLDKNMQNFAIKKKLAPHQ